MVAFTGSDALQQAVAKPGIAEVVAAALFRILRNFGSGAFYYFVGPLLQQAGHFIGAGAEASRDRAFVCGNDRIGRSIYGYTPSRGPAQYISVYLVPTAALGNFGGKFYRSAYCLIGHDTAGHHKQYEASNSAYNKVELFSDNASEKQDGEKQHETLCSDFEFDSLTRNQKLAHPKRVIRNSLKLRLRLHRSRRQSGV